jgi:hypothetical protein
MLSIASSSDVGAARHQVLQTDRRQARFHLAMKSGHVVRW